MYCISSLNSINKKSSKNRTANKNASRYVNQKAEFTGNNTYAEYKNGCYMVYSYGYHFPIYAYKHGKWYANSDKYSVSTSKHQSQLRPNNIDKYLNTEQMKQVPFKSDLELITM